MSKPRMTLEEKFLITLACLLWLSAGIVTAFRLHRQVDEQYASILEARKAEAQRQAKMIQPDCWWKLNGHKLKRIKLEEVSGGKND